MRAEAVQKDEVTLVELTDPERGISYGVVQPGHHIDQGIPIVRVTDFRAGRIDPSTPLRIAPEVEAAYSRTRLRGGEILLTVVGSVGQTAIVPPSLAGWNVARAVAVIPVAEGHDPRWVELCLRSREAQHQMHIWCTTTVQATLNLRDVARITVPMPPRPIRDGIVSIIGSLEERIDLNRRMNETLESIARALFKSWLVDFDPVRARLDGRPALLDSATAQQFPSAFDHTDYGAVPKGWQVVGLDSVAHFLNGLALQKYPAQGPDFLPVIKIAQLRSSNTLSSDRASREIPSDYIVNAGDLLFSWSGSLEVVIWSGGEGALNQHLFKVTSKSYPQWFVRGWLLEHLPEFRAIASDKATTMGHIQRRHLTEALVLVPPAPLLRRLAGC